MKNLSVSIAFVAAISVLVGCSKESSPGAAASASASSSAAAAKPSAAPSAQAAADPCVAGSKGAEAGAKILRLNPLQNTPFGGLKVPGFGKGDGRLATDSPILIEMNFFYVDDVDAYECALRQQAEKDGWKVDSFKEIGTSRHVEISKASNKVEALIEIGSGPVKIKVAVSPRK